MDAQPTYHLDWLALSGKGERDAAGAQWILMEQTGFWDSPEPRAHLVERTNAHGAVMGPMHYQQRVITITGRCYTDDPRTMREAQTHVAALCSDPVRSYALTCDSEVGTLTCRVRLDGPVLTVPVQVLNAAAFEFSLQLLAPDPFRYSTTWRTMRAELPQANTGDGLNFRYHSDGSPFRGLNFAPPGLRFGESNSTGFLQLINKGTAPSVPKYTLYGPLTRPTISTTHNGTTSQLTYNDTITEGQSVEIRPDEPAVLLNGESSRRWLLNPADFAGFAVPPNGTLRVGLTHSGPTTATGYVTATFRDAWI